MANSVDEFNEYRSRMNEKLLADNNKVIKRIFNLDTNAFTAGALDKKSKELIGLSNSLVLRCDDCVRYHLGSCHELEIPRAQVIETMSIALLIGGTIVIPHLRKAYEYWETLEEKV